MFRELWGNIPPGTRSTRQPLALPLTKLETASVSASSFFRYFGRRSYLPLLLLKIWIRGWEMSGKRRVEECKSGV